MRQLILMPAILMLLTGCPFNSKSGSGGVVLEVTVVDKTKCKPVSSLKLKAKADKETEQQETTATESEVATQEQMDEDCVEETASIETQETAASSVTVQTDSTSTPVEASTVETIISTVTSILTPEPTTPKYAALSVEASHSFGSGTLNSESQFNLTVTNAGDGDATSFSLSTLEAPFRNINHNCGSTLTASGSCTVTLGYRPTANGDHAANLTISYNDGQDDKTKSVSLSGSAAPRITSISPASSVATQTLTLSGANFTSQTVIKVGEQVCTKTAITASEMACTIPAGSGSQVVSVTDNSKTDQYSSFTYAAPANLTAAVSSHDFGRIRKNNSASSFSLTLTNNGGFTASDISVSGLDLPFSAANACTTLAPSASCTISLGYAPTTVRSDSDSMTIGYHNGSASSSLSVIVSGECIPRVVQVAAGNRNSCVLYSEGNIKCVGSIWYAGNGNTADNGSVTSWADATEVVGITNATQMSFGETAACARLSDGTVKCWGAYIQNDSTTYRTPQDFFGINNAVSVKVGKDHILIRTTDGGLKAYGLNSDGRLGDGTLIQRLSPVDVSSIPSTYQIVDYALSQTQSFALTSSGQILFWGPNSYQLDYVWGVAATNYSVPTVTSAITNAVTITSGNDHTCILDNEGIVKCWGNNSWGEMGNDGYSRSNSPIQIENSSNQLLSDFVAVEAGHEHTCAIKTDKTVWCWGLNQYGQTGIGHNDSLFEGRAKQALISNVDQISAGRMHTMALKANGDVFIWGYNAHYQMGNGNTSNVLTPVNTNIE